MENKQFEFTLAEWKIVLQLLERERAELPVEIHHCDVSAAKEQLRSRLHEIDHLLEKTRGMVDATSKVAV